MENTFIDLSKKIENYEQNRFRILKKTIIIASPVIISFLSFGIYLIYFGAYIFGGCLIGIMLLMFSIYIREITDFKRRKEIHTLLSSEIYNKDTIDDILRKINSIAPTLETSIKQRKSLQINIIYYKNLLQYLLIILDDLRSDLSIRLAEQQQSLESAKSEVENLNKTTLPPVSGGLEKGLNQVSELHRARLDRQIEQFEELQKVLMKV